MLICLNGQNANYFLFLGTTIRSEADVETVADALGIDYSLRSDKPIEEYLDTEWKPEEECSGKFEMSNDKTKDAKDAAAGFIELIAKAVTVDEAQVRTIVKDEVAPLYKALEQPKIILMKEDRELGDLPPTRHPMTDKLLSALVVKCADGHALNVWIAGPAGSGKTFAVKQVAKTMGLEYGFHGAMSMPHELVGFVDAGGHYHETVFVRLYRNGGVCLLDECDAGSSEALLVLNAALANGQMSLPTGEIIDRHSDFLSATIFII